MSAVPVGIDVVSAWAVIVADCAAPARRRSKPANVRETGRRSVERAAAASIRPLAECPASAGTRTAVSMIAERRRAGEELGSADCEQRSDTGDQWRRARGAGKADQSGVGGSDEPDTRRENFDRIGAAIGEVCERIGRCRGADRKHVRIAHREPGAAVGVGSCVTCRCNEQHACRLRSCDGSSEFGTRSCSAP